jgi:hypothetical protein
MRYRIKFNSCDCKSHNQAGAMYQAMLEMAVESFSRHHVYCIDEIKPYTLEIESVDGRGFHKELESFVGRSVYYGRIR